MKPLKFIFYLLFVFSLDAIAQESDFSTEVATYLESNRTLDQYDYAYDQLLKLLGSQHPKTEDNTQGWKYLEDNKSKALSDIKALLVPIYEKHFDKSDIQKMTAFYTSATGQQLLTDRSQMTEAQKSELDTFYNSELGKKLVSKQPILAHEVATASEGWSRDLYETSISLVKN